MWSVNAVMGEFYRRLRLNMKFRVTTTKDNKAWSVFSKTAHESSRVHGFFDVDIWSGTEELDQEQRKELDLNCWNLLIISSVRVGASNCSLVKNQSRVRKG